MARRLLVWAVAIAALAVATILALTVPRDDSALSDAVNVLAVYFGFLLTAESLVFALSFGETGGWPAWSTVTARSFFWPPIFLAGVSAALWTFGRVVDPPGDVPGEEVLDTLSLIAVFLWGLTALLATMSFVLLLRLASPSGRAAMLARELATGLAAPQRDDVGAPALHREAVAKALADRSATGLPDLVAQSETATRLAPGAWVAAATHRYAIAGDVLRQMLLGQDGDPLLACRALERAVDHRPFPASPDETVEVAGTTLSPRLIVAASASRTAAWASGVGVRLATLGHIQPGAAALLRRTALVVRQQVLDDADPFPANGDTSGTRGDSIALSGADALYWYREYGQYSGELANIAAYALYSCITGERFTGDYMEGATPLADACDALYSGAASGAVAADLRELFPDRGELEAALTRIAARHLATLVPAAAQGDTADPDDVVARLVVLGSIRGVDTVEEAALRARRAVVPRSGRWTSITARADELVGQLRGGPAHRAVGHHLAPLILVPWLSLVQAGQHERAALDTYWAQFAPRLGDGVDAFIDSVLPAGSADPTDETGRQRALRLLEAARRT